MKFRRALVFSLAALLLVAGVWVVGGNAWAARREEQSERAWAAAFGSFDDLKRKYPKHDTNETAKRLEVLAKPLGFDLAPSVRAVGTIPPPLAPSEERRRHAIFDYVSEQISKPEASIDPPPEDVTRFFEEKRAELDAIESFLVAGPPPEWAFDASVPESHRRTPNLHGQIRLQRVLMAHALAAAHAGHHDVAARSLEASWSLNESFRGRPEMVSSILGIGIARLEVGVLRKVDVEEDVWRRRLAVLDWRAQLLDSLGLEYRPQSQRTSWDAASESESDGTWLHEATNFLRRPLSRLMMADYSDRMCAEFARLRSAPLSDHFPSPPTPEGESPAQIMAAMSIPNTQSSFVRADRLVVDAELTSKVLEAKRLRKANRGRWPAAIPGIETSRYPEASWRYEVSPAGRVSITFSRELASPYGKGPLKPLPLAFSSN